MATVLESTVGRLKDGSSVVALPQTIRGKLALAFAAVAITAMIGGLVAQSSYQITQDKLAVISEASVPSVVAAQQVATMTARRIWAGCVPTRRSCARTCSTC